MTLDHKPSSSWNSLPEAARPGGESQDKRQGKGRVGGGEEEGGRSTCNFFRGLGINFMSYCCWFELKAQRPIYVDHEGYFQAEYLVFLRI